MALATWWSGDPLPALREVEGLRVAASEDAGLIAELAGLDPNEARRRLTTHHRAYLAYIGAAPVAYGWVALEGADIGELGVQFTLPAGNRYLWDFATLPAWRGRGIYPRLLQAILRAEVENVDRFWIIYAPENGASQSGIEKAGFRFAGELSFRREGGTGLVAGAHAERARAGAALLGVPLIEDVLIATAQEQPLAPCWRCVIDARARDAGHALDAGDVACWPETPEPLTVSGGCTCGCG